MGTRLRAGGQRGPPTAWRRPMSQARCLTPGPNARVTRCLCLPETLLMYACCPSVVGNSTPFPSQKWSSLDDRLHGYHA